MKLPTHIYPIPRLWLCATVSHSQCAFMARTKTNLPYLCILWEQQPFLWCFREHPEGLSTVRETQLRMTSEKRDNETGVATCNCRNDKKNLSGQNISLLKLALWQFRRDSLTYSVCSTLRTLHDACFLQVDKWKAEKTKQICKLFCVVALHAYTKLLVVYPTWHILHGAEPFRFLTRESVRLWHARNVT